MVKTSLENTAYSLPIAEARANLTELVNQAFYAGINTIIGKRGKPQAIVISYQQYLEMKKLIENNYNNEDYLTATTILKMKNPKTSWEEVKEELGLAN